MIRITHCLLAYLFLFSIPAPGQEDQKSSSAAEAEKSEKPRRKVAPQAKPRKPEQRPRPEPGHRAPERKSDKATRTFLGIGTSTVPFSLRDYLDLDEGFGIQVQFPMEDSPAEKAGLQKNDVLLKFEDQMVISPEHLSLLVRRKKSGDKVEVTVVRKGKEEILSVVLGEKEESFFGPAIHPLRPTHPHGFAPQDHEKLQRYMKEQQDLWKKHWPRFKQPTAPGLKAVKPRLGALPPKVEGRPPAVSVRPGFPVTVLGSKGVLKIDNQEGEVTITEKDGKHHIVIRDAEKKLIHESDYDAEAGPESLPEGARKHLKKMKLEDLEILPPKPKGEVKKTAEPLPQGQKPTAEKEIL